MNEPILWLSLSRRLRKNGILPPELFCEAKKVPNSFSAWALPRTTLGELTTLLKTPYSVVDGIPIPSPPHTTPMASHGLIFGALTHLPPWKNVCRRQCTFDSQSFENLSHEYLFTYIYEHCKLWWCNLDTMIKLTLYIIFFRQDFRSVETHYIQKNHNQMVCSYNGLCRLWKNEGKNKNTSPNKLTNGCNSQKFYCNYWLSFNTADSLPVNYHSNDVTINWQAKIENSH